MTPDNARLFLYEDNDGLHAVRFGSERPLRLPIGATPLGEVVSLKDPEFWRAKAQELMAAWGRQVLELREHRAGEERDGASE